MLKWVYFDTNIFLEFDNSINSYKYRFSRIILQK